MSENLNSLSYISYEGFKKFYDEFAPKASDIITKLKSDEYYSESTLKHLRVAFAMIENTLPDHRDRADDMILNDDERGYEYMNLINKFEDEYLTPFLEAIKGKFDK